MNVSNIFDKMFFICNEDLEFLLQEMWKRLIFQIKLYEVSN